MPLCIDSEGDIEIYGSPDVVIRSDNSNSPFPRIFPGSIEYYTGRLIEFVSAQDLSPTGTLPAGLWSPQPGLYTTYTPHVGLWTPPPVLLTPPHRPPQAQQSESADQI
ncbi:unnamed protein product [Brassica rapa subsp. narinosa]